MSGRVMLLAAVLGVALGWPSATYADGDEASSVLHTDSRAPYVHRLTLYDQDGTTISPTDPMAGAFSFRMTCGKCHDYNTIAHGWHFNANDPNVPPGRPWQPWLLVDPNRAAPLALSGRDWPDVLHPAAQGLSDWQFVKLFGGHLPGGGFGEPDQATMDAAPEAARWRISGPLEINCLFCHAVGQTNDPAEQETQVEAENFRWSPTATFGLGAIRGSAAKVPDDWDPMMPPSPDHPEQSGPEIAWNTARFDADERVLFELTTRVSPERCYFCHSFREVGPGAADDLLPSRDVHLAAGLLCVDCHTNELDHMIVRGYTGEAAERGDPTLAAYTCEGCHLGTPDAADPSVALGGRYAAPRPEHRGFPLVHFEKLTCTACHSGPLPSKQLHRFQTALAHGLGLTSRERDANTPPYIGGPVFALQADGRIAPQYLVWTEGGAGEVTPYRWSLAHDVRPASQALGANGCTDCHAGGPVYFGGTASADGLVAASTDYMYELRAENTTLVQLWSLGFPLRPVFKIYGFICAGIIALVLLRYGLDGAGAVLRRAGSNTPAAATVRPVAATPGVLARLALVLIVVAALIQLLTAFVAERVGFEFEGWPLVIHMGGAGLLLIALAATAVLRAERNRLGVANGALEGTFRRVVFWLLLMAGLAVMLTMLLAMLPLFGHGAMDELMILHETAGLTFVGLLILILILAGVQRRLAR